MICFYGELVVDADVRWDERCDMRGRDLTCL